MPEPPEVGLADLIVAIDRLSAGDEAAADRIAEMLQLNIERRIERIETKDVPQPVRPAKRRPREEPPPSVNAVRSDFRKSTVNRTRSDAPTFAAPLPSLPPATDEEHEPPPPFQPLFPPSWSRAMLALALATPSRNGPVDVRIVVDRLSRGLASRSLPRRLVPTLRKGAQVLVDHSSGMVPFRRDASWLVREIVKVVGEDTCRVLRFRSLPSAGVADPRRKTRLAWEPPPPGVPIVLITDFGIAVDDLATDRPSAAEWIEFLRRTSNPVIAFVPYPRRRCPQGIAALAAIIEYDRGTRWANIRNVWRHG